MEQEIEKKIKDLKDFIKEKTDQGTSNYLGKEIREICGMVEKQALSQHDVIKNEEDKVINNHIPKEDEIMRIRALNLLREEMSENTLTHIREIDYLEDWIVDAMINFHNSEFETY